MTKSKSLLCGAALIALMPEAITLAQAQDVRLEEIVVTARKREESLMEVPLAITAFSAKDIDARAMKTMNDVSAFTPSFHFVNQTGGGSGRADRSFNTLVFRGLFLSGNFGINAGGQAFLDGSPVIGAQVAGLSDIERVEVLKGPQSAYFGRSTFAGAINFVTREPGNEFRGRVSGGYSSYNSNEAALSLEGPIVEDKFAVRVSGSHDTQGGMWVNAANRNEKFGKRETNSISGQFVATPSDSLKIKGFINFFENDDGPPAQAALKGVAGDFNCDRGGRSAAGAPRGGYFCGVIPDSDELPARIISSNYLLNSFTYGILVENRFNLPVIFDPAFRKSAGLGREAWQGDIRIDYDFADGYSFSSLTAYHREKSMSIIDLSFRDGQDRPNALAALGPNRPAFVWWLLAVQGQQKDFSQELRVSSPADQPLRWTFGGNYLAGRSPGGSVYGLSVLGPGFFAAITQQKIDTPAVFGGVYYDFTPELTLSAEARYQWDKIKQIPKIGANGQPVPATTPTLQETFKSFSPRVSLDYKFAENSTLYALFSRGYRPGGFNAILATSPPSVVAQFAAFGATLAYDQEKLDNFELGAKVTWLDGRAQTRLTGYYMAYRKGQVGNSIPFTNPDGSLNLATATVNTGKTNLKGLELEGEIVVTENFQVQGTFGLNDTEIKSFFCNDCKFVYNSFDSTGNSLPSAPKWKWSLSAEYAAPVFGDYEGFTRVDYSHQGKYFVDYSNVAQGGAQDIVNLRIGLRTDELSIEGFVTNLLKDYSPPSAVIGNDLFTFAGTNEIRYSLASKRQIGVRARYNF
ncbi:MAG: TonB-dependent receptor [Rhodospirillaceae bacterium]|nr:TonB-dependent receptor [Rhodospirillaceae bacterium]